MEMKEIADFQVPVLASEENCTIKFFAGKSTIFIGANGSGKTRLAKQIDMHLGKKSHRIPAQKDIRFPAEARIFDLTVAENRLRYDIDHESTDHRNSARPVTGLISDFGHLLNLLVSDQYETNAKLDEAFQKDDESLKNKKAYQTRIRKVSAIWSSLLPDRELNTTSTKITITNANKKYQATELSDGERVIFYQIGQAICAPENCVVIYDEPELHLHKSITGKLYDQIEQARPDCHFIYITHDLDFVKSRAQANKYAILRFADDKWQIKKIEQSEDIPEELIMQIMGSREPILCIEGKENSIDKLIYPLIYPNFKVIALGSCKHVINSVKALRRHKDFSHYEVRGIIDRDGRNEGDIKELEEAGIYCLSFTEIENIFLDEKILEAVLKSVNFSSYEIKYQISLVKETIFNFVTVKEKIENHAFNHTKRSLNRPFIDILGNYHENAKKSVANLATAIKSLCENISIQDTYEKTMEDIKTLADSQCYSELIKIFDHKGMLTGAVQKLNLFKDRHGYIDHIIRNIKVNTTGELAERLREILPIINLPEQEQQMNQPIAAE